MLKANPMSGGRFRVASVLALSLAILASAPLQATGSAGEENPQEALSAVSSGARQVGPDPGESWMGSSSVDSFTARGPLPLNFTVPFRKGSVADYVRVEFTTVPAAPPRALSAIVPGEGEIWRFSGRFGALDRFWNGNTSGSLVFAGPQTRPLYLDLPDGSYQAAALDLGHKSSTGKYRFSLETGGSAAWNRSDATSPFSPGVALESFGRGTGRVAVDDLNGDLKDDLLAGDWLSNLLTHQSQPTGQMKPERWTALNSSEWPANGVGTWDLDQDGDRDVLVGSANGHVWRLRNDNGAFSNRSFFTYVSDTTREWEFADLDNNLKPEAIAISDFYDRVYVQWNPNGSPSQQPQVFPTIGSRPAGLVPKDFDADSWIDLAVGNRAGCPGFLRNNRSGGFDAWKQLPCVYDEIRSLSAGNLDGDQMPDLVVGMDQQRIQVMLDAYQGALTRYNRTLLSGPVEDTLVTDVDGDGLADVTAGTGYGYLLWFKGDGAGNLSSSDRIGGAGNIVRSLAAADGDLDGRLDLVAANDAGLTLLPNSKSGFTERPWILDPLKKAISKAQPFTDQDGTRVKRVALNFTSDFSGKLDASRLDFRYRYTATVNATAAVSAYASKNPAKPSGVVDVPVNVSSQEPGEIEVRYTVAYTKSAPYVEIPFPTPAVVAIEDTPGSWIDLERHFADERDDGRLAFQVLYNSNGSLLDALIEGPRLAVHPKPEASGTAIVRVSATDSQGLSTPSENLTVVVAAVNDLPTLSAFFPKELKTRAKIPLRVPLDSFIDDVEEGPCLKVKTGDPQARPLDCPPGPTAIELDYLAPAEDVPLNVSIVDSAGGGANASVIVDVKQENAPIFLATPPLRTPRGVNGSVADLASSEFVADNNTALSDLNFSFVQPPQGPKGVEFRFKADAPPHEIEVLFHDPFARGYAVLWVRVSDGPSHDETNITVLLEEAVRYIGGISGKEVQEDTTWKADLTKHFTRGDVIFYSTDGRVRIDANGTASWTPSHVDPPVLGLVFTAVDRVDKNNRDSSDPVDLTVRLVNDPPAYWGGLLSADVPLGESWSYPLHQAFIDEEDDAGLTFGSNYPDDVTIDFSGKAQWIPPVGAKNLTDVVFTATDAEDSSLTATSPPIDLYYVPKNLPPRAFIESVSPSPAYRDQVVRFVGNGSDPDGAITAYNWTDRTDPANPSLLSLQREFVARFQPGVHAIAFEVRDDNGNWSAPAIATLTVFDQNAPVGASRPLWAATLIGVGAALVAAGAVLSRRVAGQARRRAGLRERHRREGGG
jgi:hypothetical protein